MFQTIGAMAVDIKGSPVEVFQRTRDYGCNAVELVLGKNLEKADLPVVQRASRETGMRVLAFNQLIGGLSSFDHAAIGEGTRQFSQLLDCCVECQAPYAVVYCFFESKDGEPARCVEQFVENLNPLVRRAEREGIVIVIENEPKGITNDPQTMARIVEKVNSPCFKVNLDPDNFYNGGCEPFPYAYAVLRKHVAYLHAKDSCRYVPEIHGSQEYILKRAFDALCVPLGEGAVNWDGICRSLRRDEYQGPVVIETHIRDAEVDEGFRKGVAFLKRRWEVS